MALQRRVDPGLQGQVIVDEGVLHGGHCGVDHLRLLWPGRINCAQGVESVLLQQCLFKACGSCTVHNSQCARMYGVETA